ncbi:MAG: FecR domain-containing protein [Bacteroidota bacterium]
MEKDSAQELLKKYKNGNCTKEEKAIIETWYLQLPTADDQLLPEELEAAVNRVAARLPVKPITKQKSLWPRIAAAASILLILSVGGYFIIHPRQRIDDLAANTIRNDIPPGGNKAILTLSNGKRVVLTDAHNGKLATEGNSIVSKIADGQVTYTGNGSKLTAQVIYNTMATPQGGQYTLTLSDGTKVILNAASSLRYPTKFSGTERRVELTGEAYFEVAHNKAMPFHVATKQQDVKVLGTHFNINSYANEPGTRTTLLEGSVLINGKTVLKPGQQAIVSGSLLKVYPANTEIAVAWKNNKFMFDNENIQDIMRMVARWYNVDVVYTGDLPDRKFGGSVSRFNNISKVLSILELTGNIHFKIEGRKIIVSK